MRLVGTVQDITERRRMEVRLRQAAVVFETTAEGIFILDAGRHIISVNPACCDLTDYTAEEILGGDPEVLLHGRPHSVEFYPRLASARAGSGGERSTTGARTAGCSRPGRA